MRKCWKCGALHLETRYIDIDNQTTMTPFEIELRQWNYEKWQLETLLENLNVLEDIRTG